MSWERADDRCCCKISPTCNWTWVVLSAGSGRARLPGFQRLRRPTDAPAMPVLMPPETVPPSFPRPPRRRFAIVPADPAHKKSGGHPMASAQYDKLHLFIDGEWLGAAGRKTGDVVNPATGETIGT